MRRLLLLAVSVVPLMTFIADDASAQRRFGDGGFHGGGFRAGGFGGGMRHGMAPGFRGGIRPGFAGRGFRGGFYPGGAGWGGGYGWRGRYAYPGRYYGYGRRGYSPYYGLATGLALGAAAAYPYYGGYGYGGYPYAYQYPYSYPAYETYPVRSALGGYCSTPIKTCQLINAAGIGGGCSCRVAGGRARGTVVGP